MAAGFELHCRGGKILWGDETVSIRGINWFGLETADFALHGEKNRTDYPEVFLVKAHFTLLAGASNG